MNGNLAKKLVVKQREIREARVSNSIVVVKKSGKYEDTGFRASATFNNDGEITGLVAPPNVPLLIQLTDPTERSASESRQFLDTFN